MESQSTFGELIRRFRRREGLTQEELAERAELSPRGLIYLERGERRPQPGTARRLADALNLSGEERTALLAVDEQEPVTGGAPRAVLSDVRTFLICDVRGYTAFSAAHGDEAAARLAERFAAIVGDVVTAHGGEMTELRGDEALSSFTSPRQALRAAYQLQNRFALERERDSSLPLFAGIGLDAGEAVEVRDGYRGGALNLAARLCSLAQAGEILAGDTVAGLARKVEGLTYLDRGHTRLKGIPEPVHVVQIVAEDAVPADVVIFTADHEPVISLPDQPTTFIGREQELQVAGDLLRQEGVRLLTLTGPGGTGKTRLALKLAEEVAAAYPDGVFFVGLAPVVDPDLVPSAIAGAIGVKEVGRQPLIETLQTYLKQKKLLLVLDNLEHLPGAAPLVSLLLSCSPTLTILTTTRETLRLAGEHEYPVPPLGLPDRHHVADLESLAQYDAVAVFLDRARAIRPDVKLTEDNAQTVLEICRRLDGLPLALELAAARVRLFPPEALLARLENRLTVLTGGARNVPTRQQTLRGAIDWSYSLLNEEDRTLFTRLAVFAGGCTFEAAESVCNLEGDLDILEGLDSLITKSLLRQEGDREPRFLMLDTIREYALEKLAERGQLPQIQNTFAEYYTSLIEDTPLDLEGPGQRDSLERLEMEHDNLRTALDWAAGTGHAELGLTLAGSIWRFWEDRGHLSEGRRRLEELLQISDSVRPAVRSRALQGAGWLAGLQGQYDQANSALDESLRIAREAGDEKITAYVLTTLGALQQIQGNYVGAVAAYEESVALFTSAGDAADAVRPRHNLATLAYIQGDYTRAQVMFAENTAEMRRVRNTRVLVRSLEGLALALLSQRLSDRAQAPLEESLDLARELGDRRQIASCLHNLGCVVMSAGDYDRANVLFEEALALVRAMDDRFRITACLESIGSLARQTGDIERAREMLTEGLLSALQGGYRNFVPGILESLAGVVLTEGDAARAATLFGAAHGLRKSLGVPRAGEDEELYAADIARGRSILTEESWSAHFEKGKELSLDEAVNQTLDRTVVAGL
ncbi:MAG TPA: tetratricopeptide repeat protein [Chloroflexota bacterium]